MTDLHQGDVVIVQFPYTDRPDWEVRPAVVVSARALGSRWPLVWAVMITSAKREGWPGDIAIENYAAIGLRTPCVVRTAKITNIEADSAQFVGRLDVDLTARVMAEIRRALSDNPSVS